MRIDPQLYIREIVRATPEEIYLTLAAPPVEPIARRYSLDEIRYSEPLRARMPRIDIDTVNFEFGSWEIAPDQVSLVAVMGIVVSFFMSRMWERAPPEKKILILRTEPSQNLAAVTDNFANKLEFRFAVSPAEKQIIRSLFAYQVTLKNQSKEGADNIALHLYPPTKVKLLDPPTITTNSKILADFAAQNKLVSPDEIILNLDFLGAGQVIMVAYSGYSEEEIGSTFINVEVRKKGWEVQKYRRAYVSTTYSPGGAYSSTFTPAQVCIDDGCQPGGPQVSGTFSPDYADGVYGDGYSDFPSYDDSANLLSKRIMAYNGGDVIALFFLFFGSPCRLA